MKVAGVVGIYKCSCRLVRRFTATKSFEKFRQPKSAQNEKRSVDNAVPKSTAYKAKWSCKVFEEWKQNRVVKSENVKTDQQLLPIGSEYYFLHTNYLIIVIISLFLYSPFQKTLNGLYNETI